MVLEGVLLSGCWLFSDCLSLSYMWMKTQPAPLQFQSPDGDGEPEPAASEESSPDRATEPYFVSEPEHVERSDQQRVAVGVLFEIE